MQPPAINQTYDLIAQDYNGDGQLDSVHLSFDAATKQWAAQIDYHDHRAQTICFDDLPYDESRGSFTDGKRFYCAVDDANQDGIFERVMITDHQATKTWIFHMDGEDRTSITAHNSETGYSNNVPLYTGGYTDNAMYAVFLDDK